MRRVIVIASLAASLVGCPAPDDESAIYVEDFETTCDGTPCGWAQITGAEDGASYVETLPGDHGLQLVGRDVTVRGGTDEASQSMISTQLLARANARCDLGSHLVMRATIALQDANTLTYEAELVPDVTWTSATRDQNMRVVEVASPPWQIERVLGVSLRKEGDGSCEVDYLAIRSLRTF
ncbi:hypothetical protein [Sandaracinus amylolyticus]|uniref:Lipoprotein n=1 Tax=Sandaracinus amylolyticus TaxID=927083 RepID=A0A0F6W682_9BACT|nr:hypothetical protein [Sandaracinus amylolyticus]AKF08461.1 hypothetical protein DB32_005610 [Sandaracinus amylolyticus]